MPQRLRNKHGKHLIAHHHAAEGHNDPHKHGHHASHFHIEQHPTEPNHGTIVDTPSSILTPPCVVVIRGHHGKFLSHEHSTGKAVFTDDPYSHNAAWKQEQHGSHVAFKSKVHKASSPFSHLCLCSMVTTLASTNSLMVQWLRGTITRMIITSLKCQTCDLVFVVSPNAMHKCHSQFSGVLPLSLLFKRLLSTDKLASIMHMLRELRTQSGKL